MKKRCKKCGMIRAIKDLVKTDKENFICFSCWNQYLKEKGLI
ncbi:MAG: hypothetical protein ACFFBH_11425 [Promethearchaeota archaeon]